MIALDTNVLVRYLVKDDANQSAQAIRFVERSLGAGEELFLSDVTLCEAVWVLESAYGVSKAEILATLASLVRVRQLRFRDSEVIERALTRFSAGKGDFADYVIAECARSEGCDQVVTFDKALLKEPGFLRP
jgi:predicted nucleic-acid-binding protein